MSVILSFLGIQVFPVNFMKQSSSDSGDNSSSAGHDNLYLSGFLKFITIFTKAFH
jgi:hypothetical protein